MMSKSLHLNGQTWNVSFLGEQALLLKPEQEEIPLSLIHQTYRRLEQSMISGVIDLIPTYESIGLIYNRLLEDLNVEIEKLQNQISDKSEEKISHRKYEIPVCYGLGLDWKEVEKHTGLTQELIIKKHTQTEYTVAMMGFMPGFVYLSGMDKTLECPRKENPRTKIPEGAVGIAGGQTGVYSLESPGGWQIIGRTPHSFFNIKEEPPTYLKLGDKLVFHPISIEEFEELKNERAPS
ncbi:MAG: 5-oxoprolinase subunit PxpB [Gracilimonas sp.]|uniref:5-oxoprolinase subunit PxpB n=1 Tax=Gracilimonas sp. TaxID=1974203 RepID=UPI0019CD771F|nr:5-oxoprolinase subunit PxpB [Gracilimonas sp.]MBD3615116.1 5-oxoprolinase subunit PxpB [Gracilimonas sp.]